eukprot:740952-Pleurochrysis_carterae.AAC.1
MSSQAARRSYAEACAGSGRELLRLLASEASSTSTATTDGAGVEYIHPPLASTEPRVAAPAAQLPDSVLAEKVANATRRLGDGVSTVLDVKLALNAGVGNLPRTIQAARNVLSDVDARNVQRNVEA